MAHTATVQEEPAIVRTVFLAAVTIIASGCSVFKPKLVGHEYKEYTRETGCNYYVEYLPEFEYAIEDRGNSKILKVYSGRFRSQGTGHITRRQIFEKYEKALTFPPRYYTKYVGEETVSQEEGYCRKVRVPGGSGEIKVRITPVGMRGQRLPTSNGEVAFDLLEPAILAGRDRTLQVRTDAGVTYRMPGEPSESKRAISRTLEIPSGVVTELIDSFDRLQNGEVTPDERERIVAAKYAYDMYDKLKLSAEFAEKVGKVRDESRVRGIAIRETESILELRRFLKTNVFSFALDIFLSLVFSEGEAGPPITFVDP